METARAGPPGTQAQGGPGHMGNPRPRGKQGKQRPRGPTSWSSAPRWLTASPHRMSRPPTAPWGTRSWIRNPNRITRWPKGRSVRETASPLWVPRCLQEAPEPCVGWRRNRRVPERAGGGPASSSRPSWPAAQPEADSGPLRPLPLQPQASLTPTTDPVMTWGHHRHPITVKFGFQATAPPSCPPGQRMAGQPAWRGQTLRG